MRSLFFPQLPALYSDLGLMPDLLSYESLDLLSCEEHCGVNMSDARLTGCLYCGHFAHDCETYIKISLC